MTDKQKITELEKRVAELEIRLDEARRNSYFYDPSCTYTTPPACPEYGWEYRRLGGLHYI